MEIPEPLNLWEAFSAGRNRCSSVTNLCRQTSVTDAEACVGPVAIMLARLARPKRFTDLQAEAGSLSIHRSADAVAAAIGHQHMGNP